MKDTSMKKSFAALWILTLVINSSGCYQNYLSGSRIVETKAKVIDRPNPVVTQKWELPAVLKEISGIAYLDNDRFACIQDEKGTIYIYNTGNNIIEKEIPFAGDYDFEGIAVVGSTAYALRSNGIVYEIQSYNTAPAVKEYPTHLNSKQNVEGLCYDAAHNRLLLAIKGKEDEGKSYKGIYGFDLVTKKLSLQPVIKIDLKDKIWGNTSGNKTMRPSDLAIHPTTRDIYIIDGEIPKLLILRKDGKHKFLYPLDGPDFTLPRVLLFRDLGICLFAMSRMQTEALIF